MERKSRHYLRLSGDNADLDRINVLATSSFVSNLRWFAASWVFRRCAIGFPSRLAIEGVRASVIKDRIAAEHRENRSTRVRVRALVLIRPWNI